MRRQSVRQPLGLDHGALQRSIGSLAFRIGTERERKARYGDSHKLAPTEQQVQITFDADVTPTPVWQQVQVDFQERIVINHWHSNTPYDRPHVSFGHEVENGPPVAIAHHVRQWIQDKHDNFTGALVEIGVWSPTIPANNAPNRVTGRIHMRIQGDSVPIDDGAGQDLDG